MSAKTYQVGDPIRVQLKDVVDPKRPIVQAKVSRVGGKSGGQPFRVVYRGRELCVGVHCAYRLEG